MEMIEIDGIAEGFRMRWMKDLGWDLQGLRHLRTMYIVIRIPELNFLLEVSQCVKVDFKAIVMFSWWNVILESHDFYYYSIVLKEIMWYVLMLILRNEFRICMVTVDGRDDDVDGMISGSSS
eukprot:Gb_14844 [translate_table: standard]